VYSWLMSKQVRLLGTALENSIVCIATCSMSNLTTGSAQSEAQVYNAAAEIGTGFMLIIQLLTPARSILLTFVYWYAVHAF